jgi:hypothetical protein
MELGYNKDMRKKIPCRSMQATIFSSKEGVECASNEGACLKKCSIEGCEFSAMSWRGWHGEIKTDMFNITSCVRASEVEGETISEQSEML